MKKWSKNSYVIDNNRIKIKQKIFHLFNNPDQFADVQFVDSELKDFFNKFEEAIAESDAAYKFIKDIKDIERFKQVISGIEEINTIVQNNNDMLKHIEKNIPNKGTILETEWKRQIALYKESIDKLKPKTALELLIKLEDSYEENKPSNVLVAKIEFLKAQCSELLGNIDDVYRSYIKAHKLNPNTIEFMEMACYSYVKIEENEKAKTILDKLLAIDEYNYMAWAVKVIMSDRDNLSEILYDVPKIVMKEKNFKRVLYFNTRAKTKYTNLYEVYDKFSIFPDISASEHLPLTFESYWDKVFLLETSLNKLLKTISFDFSKAFVGDIDLLKQCKCTIDNFLGKLSESEITSGFEMIKFYKHYFDFILTEDITVVNKMKEQFEQFETPQEWVLLIIVNCLQLTNQEEEAIRIINQQKEKIVQSIMFEAFCYLKNEDYKNYVVSSNEYITKVDKVDEISCGNFLAILCTCKKLKLFEKIDIELSLKEKNFSNDSYKIIIEELYNILSENITNKTLSNLKSVEEDFLKIKSKLLFYVAYSYYLDNEFELSIKLFKQFVDENNDIRDLSYYIRALYKSKSHNSELLSRLKNWRNNLPFNGDFLVMEVNLRMQLSDWKECLDISNCVLNRFPLHEDFLVCKLSALNKLNNRSAIIDLVNIFNSFVFKNTHKAIQVAGVLIENQFHKEALDIMYNVAKDSKNPELRMAYFISIIHMPEELVNEKRVAGIGDFVKYSINGNNNYIEIANDNTLSMKFIGSSKGDVIEHSRQMTNISDSIKVERIMNKYLYLHDLIIDEVNLNPLTQIPMESIQFDTTSIESMNKTFVELMSNDDSEEVSKKALEQYYSYKLSFTEIILQIYNLDYIGGYFDLIYKQKGIVIFPVMAFPKNILEEGKEIVLDLSSLLIFYQIHSKHNVKFKHKFIIGRESVELIRNRIRKERMEPRESMSLSISNGDVIPHKITPKERNGNITYLNKLVEWIEQYCIETIVEEKLDIIRSLDKEIKGLDLVIENIYLLYSNEKRILVSDDSFYFKFYEIRSRKIISSEYYLKYTDSEYETHSIEFINNKYIGNLISLDNLLSEYKKEQNDQPNRFSHCLSNMKLLINPAIDTIKVLIGFFKQVVIEDLMTEFEFKEEAKKAIVNLLEGQNDKQSYLLTFGIIYNEFEIIKDQRLILLKCYNEVLKEKGIDFNSILNELMSNSIKIE